MGRLEARYNVNLPVNLTLTDQVNDWRVQATTANIGLGGAFFAADFSLPDSKSIQAEAAVLGHGHVLLPGRVVRRDNSGFAVKFERLGDELRSLLRITINEELLALGHCPVCHNYRGENVYRCPFCNHSLDWDADAISVPRQPPDLSLDPHEQIDLAMDRFMLDLEEIAKICPVRERDEDTYIQRIQEIICQFVISCKYFEKAVQDVDIIRNRQRQFRRKTDPLISKSHFMQHARTWPHGYVGDHRIIEDIYRNIPLSEGLGYLLDRVFLSTTLGRAVPERKNTMRDIIEEKIIGNNKLKVLNIGCGSCRELVELGAVIKKSEAEITCLDFDAAALDFSAARMAMLGIEKNFIFKKYNALKMINPDRNVREFGKQNLIYSIGLLDYLADDVLVRFISAMYELLAPGGEFIAVFKDSDRYDAYEYHWVVEWDAFYQRTEEDSKALIRRANIPGKNISVKRDGTGVILFYSIEKNE